MYTDQLRILTFKILRSLKPKNEKGPNSDSSTSTAGAIEWQLLCLAAILLQHALIKVTSVLPLVALMAYPVYRQSTLLRRQYSQ